jgi:CDP-glycerol glycerophosphotransferase (TagB/SpsB family)
LSKKLLGLFPSDPWIYNGGDADYILIESDFARDYYTNAGIDSAKFVEIGSPIFDTLSKHRNNLTDKKNSLVNTTFREPSLPLILCSLPPDLVNTTVFNSYKEMLSFWAEILHRGNTCNVLVSLHPRTSYDQVSFIESERIVIAQKDSIETLLPHCDIFVACISATIRWALACQKPVLNFDMFGLNYSDYTELSEVKTVFDAENFKNAYNEMVLEVMSGDETGKCIESNNYFGFIDGEFKNRLHQFIRKVL